MCKDKMMLKSIRKMKNNLVWLKYRIQRVRRVAGDFAVDEVRLHLQSTNNLEAPGTPDVSSLSVRISYSPFHFLERSNGSIKIKTGERLGDQETKSLL